MEGGRGRRQEPGVAGVAGGDDVGDLPARPLPPLVRYRVLLQRIAFLQSYFVLALNSIARQVSYGCEFSDVQKVGLDFDVTFVNSLSSLVIICKKKVQRCLKKMEQKDLGMGCQRKHQA